MKKVNLILIVSFIKFIVIILVAESGVEPDSLDYETSELAVSLPRIINLLSHQLNSELSIGGLLALSSINLFLIVLYCRPIGRKFVPI